MRLIDADALMGVVTKNSYMLRSEHNTTDYGMFLSGIKQAVDEAPAADVQPVVHGRWIDIGENDADGNGKFRCSVCGSQDRHARDIEVPHCWYCGATMDLEADE